MQAMVLMMYLTGDGSKEILYRSAEDLLNWFEQNNRSVDSE